MSAEVQGPLYVYAVTRAEAPVPDDLTGLEGAPVARIDLGALAAVVSPSPPAQIRPQRKHLRAHQDVVNALLEAQTPLPFAFGTVVPSAEALADLLRRHTDTFARQLDAVAGCGEFTVRVRWTAENLFAWFVEREPELQAARDRVFARNPPPRDELVELGRRFDALRAVRRSEIALVVTEVLGPWVQQFRIGEPAEDAVAATLAALVRTDRYNQLVDAADALSDALPDRIEVHISGPAVPYSFVTMAVEA